MIVQGPEVAEWVMEKAGGMAHNGMTALGYVKDGKLVAGFAFEGFMGKSMTAHQRQDSSATRGFWKAVAEYVFVTCKCERVTGPVPASNEKAVRLNKKIGFEVEAVLKKAGPEGCDMLLMVLWKDKCRMLNW